MTLDEAIKHAEEVAEGQYNLYDYYLQHGEQDDYVQDCLKCGTEHRQLAKWLKELKHLHEGMENIKAQVASAKATMKTENSDYMTGYVCALSAVEGMIDEVVEEL